VCLGLPGQVFQQAIEDIDLRMTLLLSIARDIQSANILFIHEDTALIWLQSSGTVKLHQVVDFPELSWPTKGNGLIGF